MRVTSLGLMLAISASPLQAQQLALDARTAQAIVTGCAAHATAKNQGGSLRLANVTKKLKDLLVVTKLVTVFDSYDSQKEALASFS